MTQAITLDPANLTLDDGRIAATPEELLAALDKLEVEHHTSTHRALFTVEEAKTVQFSVPGAHTKNLFLRNKKGRMFLVVIEQDKQIDLRSLRDRLQVPGGHFAFASVERMVKYLGVIPGSVSPLALFNDTGGQVQLVFDSSLLEQEWIYVHPCRNTHTSRLRTKSLLETMSAWGHTAQLVNFDDEPAAVS